ncbi:unnamed protein product, partial [Linum tenue]
MATTDKAAYRPYWRVQVIDSEGQRSMTHLHARDVWYLPHGTNFVVPFVRNQPVHDGGGLLGQFLGLIARDVNYFPISYDNWHVVPSSYKNEVLHGIIDDKVFVEPRHKDRATKYILRSLGSKWKGNRYNLYNKKYKHAWTREQNINNPLEGIPKEQWASFIDYRQRKATQDMSKRNTRNRGEYQLNHTGGSKSIARKTVEMEKIAALEATGVMPKKPAPSDSLGQVLGKEHSGRIVLLTLRLNILPTLRMVVRDNKSSSHLLK